jgi:hypothetical protein
MASPHPILIDLARGFDLGGVVCTDADRLFESAVEHRMTGLLQTAVERGHLLVPPPMASRLSDLDLATWARHAQLIDGLTTVAQRLDDAGVRWVAFKGVAREKRLYARPGERPSWDLDIAIAPHHSRDVGDVALLLDPRYPHARAVSAMVSRGEIQAVALLLDGERAPVDLHVDPMSMGVPTPYLDTLWASPPEMIDLGACPIPCFPIEVEILHALVNLARDRFRHLLGHIDAARLAALPHLDRVRVAEIARETGLTPLAHLAWEAVSEVLECGSPPFTRRAGPVRSWLWERTWGPSVRLRGIESRHRRVQRSQAVLPLLVEGTGPAWLRWMAHRPFPSRDLVRLRHGDGPYLVALSRGRTRHYTDRWRARRAVQRRSV